MGPIRGVMSFVDRGLGISPATTASRLLHQCSSRLYTHTLIRHNVDFQPFGCPTCNWPTCGPASCGSPQLTTLLHSRAHEGRSISRCDGHRWTNPGQDDNPAKPITATSDSSSSQCFIWFGSRCRMEMWFAADRLLHVMGTSEFPCTHDQL